MPLPKSLIEGHFRLCREEHAKNRGRYRPPWSLPAQMHGSTCR
jgi:hypothetical protein